MRVKNRLKTWLVKDNDYSKERCMRERESSYSQYINKGKEDERELREPQYGQTV